MTDGGARRLDRDTFAALLADTKRYCEEAVRRRDSLQAGEARARPGMTRDEEISELDELIADYDEAIQRLERVPGEDDPA